MNIAIVTKPVPLHLDAAGVLRVGETRVSLDSVLAAFHDGATPEEIVQQYDALALADVYLEWLAVEQRVLLTHDVTTMRPYAEARVAAGEPMPGVFEVSQYLPIGEAIEEIFLGWRSVALKANGKAKSASYPFANCTGLSASRSSTKLTASAFESGRR